jgi:exopolyphosphatase/guanosine-5'-triphosphate,3'-diphosphate pyrophosphatase
VFVDDPRHPLAVIDIGSNSGRVVVVRMSPSSHLEILADARMPLRLARDLRESPSLAETAIERTVDAVRDFVAIGRGAGARRAVAVATAAVRDASNSAELLRRIEEETGVRVDVIDGEEEAFYAFLGAVHGLPVESGLLFDIGGGSMEISSFRDRTILRTWTLPLGALQLSDLFLVSDPPTKDELNDLREFVTEQLSAAGLPLLGEGERLIGTGGAVRNLARIDERRHRFFIPHLHGYTLPLERLQEVGSTLAKRAASKRASTPGLNADRADSIVGGAIVVEALIEAVEADDVLVSGQGLREGIALATLTGGGGVNRPDEVRRGSIEALAGRFATWNAEVANTRVDVVATLADSLGLDPDRERREMLEHAATILDAGKAVDYYDRYQHAASIALAADLAGYSHRQLALLAAILREADGTRTGKSFRPLLDAQDRAWVHRAGILLVLADEVVRRTPPGEPASITCEVHGGTVMIAAPALGAWQPRALANRFRGAFHKRLAIEEAT